ncbi:MAG TPA: FxsA family protein [Propionibacteriaceae bacterium]|nr:FxsA family protein [Propionibacteriaceae bacterium]
MAASRRRWSVWVVVGLVVALPIIEVVVLIATGRLIGAWPTIGLMLATSLLGAWLAQREGRRAWTALRQAFVENRMPTGELADAVLIMIGGLFLLLPGFISDVIGLVCLLPFTRPLARRFLSWVVSRAATSRGIDLNSLTNQARIIQDPSSVIRGETVPDPGQPRQDRVIRGEVED